ncbi:MAG: hypothetical protein FD167_6061 [bacterium]|nr:MAG: hypothetical protein FD167_6061 [bacterium]
MPKAKWIDYPDEKFHAIVDLDLANSRMKDFYDI